MKKTTFERVIADLIAMPEVIHAEMKPALTKCAVEVHKTAVKKFGKYQPQVGPYPAWLQLTIQTVNRKMDHGGASGPNPLIGAYGQNSKNTIYPVRLQQSIQMHVSDMWAQVGTNDPLGLWHEYGWSEFNVHYPPRPFLRPALYENEEFIRKTIKTDLALALGAAIR